MTEKGLKEKMTDAIEGIAKEEYLYMIRIIEESLPFRKNKRLIIFGAGIMGLQFSFVLEEHGENDYLFCDNNEMKWAEQWANSKVISPDALGKNDYIFIAMENYEDCKKQVETMGYIEKKDFVVLANASEQMLTKDFPQDINAHTLVLGDCTVSIVSMKEANKVSIKELLYQPENIKVLALNGLYMREYYCIFQMCLDKMQNLKNVVILLGMDVFSNRYHLLPRNQHYRVLSGLCEICNCRNREVLESLEEIKRRRDENTAIHFMSADRSPKLNTQQISVNMKNQMKFLWLYAIDETTESMKYLEKFMDECRKKGIAFTCVLLPVNYDLGYSFYQDRFRLLYGSNVKVLRNNIEGWGGQVMDLSFELGKEYFLPGRAVNEGFRYAGRKYLAEKITHEIGR